MTAFPVLEDAELDDNVAKRVFIAAADQLNPYVSSRDPEVDAAIEPLVERVLDEVAGELGVDSFDERNAKIRGRSLITGWLSDLMMKDADRDALRDQLGWRGDLDPIYYDVEVSDKIKEKGPTIGVRPSHVENAIHSPDGHTHYNPDAETEKEAITLFTQDQGSFTLLVQAFRSGNVIKAQNAFRVYYSDIRAGEYARSPKEYLHAFAEAFGVPIKVGDQVRKFFWHETFTKPKDSDKTEIMEIRAPEGRKVWGLTYAFRSGPTLHIIQAFALDVERYRDSLRSKGVHLSLT